METYISILRGINVSGQKLIKMLDLKVLYELIGFKNVRTYIQSGNVIFESDSVVDMNKKIENKILEKYNFQVPVIIRTVGEMKKVIDFNPYLKNQNIDLTKLHITFLDSIPLKENIEKLTSVDQTPDQFILHAKEIYLHTPNGYGNTKLNNNFFEKKLKISATTRNWNSVNELFRIGNNG